MIKRASDAGEWAMFDNKRDPHNLTHQVLRANNNAVEEDTTNDNEIDILSNGFKARGTGGWTNINGETFIYIAFAEHPFVSSKGVPTTAR